MNLELKSTDELVPAAVEDARGARLRVLAVDDSPLSRKLLEHALQDRRYEVTFAKDGQQALESISQLRPDIVITDWMVPDLSGPELCRKIRGESKTGYTYVILLTSNVEKDNIVEGLAAGADDYLTKPFHNEELLARIGVGHRIIEMNRVIEGKNQLLEAAARADSLTGLPNRPAVEEYGTKQLGGAIRHGFSMWVILADLKKFKIINNRYGYRAGDEVLKRFATILRKNTRSSDICGRLGGDAFILVVTHVQEVHVIQLVERLQASFAAEEFTFVGQNVQLTACFGVGGFKHQDQPEFHDLLTRADCALYEAKSDGRVRIKNR